VHVDAFVRRACVRCFDSFPPDLPPSRDTLFTRAENIADNARRITINRLGPNRESEWNLDPDYGRRRAYLKCCCSASLESSFDSHRTQLYWLRVLI